MYHTLHFAFCKSGVVKKCRSDLLVIRVKALRDQRLAKILNAVFKLFPDKTQKYECQHRIALFKERAGITRLAQNIAAFEKDRVQIQSLFCIFPGHGRIPSFATLSIQYHSNSWLIFQPFPANLKIIVCQSSCSLRFRTASVQAISS